MALAPVLAHVEDVRGATDVPIQVAGIVSLALGVLILVIRRLLNYVVAGYLIVVGALWIAAALD